MTPSQCLKFRQRGEQGLANRMLAMNAEERQTFDQLREPEHEPTTAEGDWLDVSYDAMDVDSILDGTAVVDLSHEGGKFYEFVKHCIETTSR